MSMTITIQCPRCEKYVDAPEALRGGVADGPRCLRLTRP